MESAWRAMWRVLSSRFSVLGSQPSKRCRFGGYEQLVTPLPPCRLVIGAPKISAEPRHYWRKRTSERGLPGSGYGSFTRPKSNPFPPRMNADQHGSEEFDRKVPLRIFKDRAGKNDILNAFRGTVAH